MARKGQFKKGGGRHGGSHTKTRSRSRSGGSTAIVVVPQRAPTHKRRATHHTRKVKARGRRRHGGGGHGGITPAKVVGSAILLANVAGTNSGPLGDKVYNLIQKVPGAKTFGGAATAGLLLGGVYKFTRFGGKLRPWMAAAGLVGLIGAGLKIGEQGTAFKWLGGEDDRRFMDVE